MTFPGTEKRQLDAGLVPALPLVFGLTPDEMPSFIAGVNRDRCAYFPLVLLHAALAVAPHTTHVITPLVADTFDVMDIAHELTKAEYEGELTVVIPRLPRPEVILRELRAINPQIRITLLPQAQH